MKYNNQALLFEPSDSLDIFFRWWPYLKYIKPPLNSTYMKRNEN